ncbi:hypothetical protein KY358_06640 [Candidatus Woesearchaeota archaeon]|nr:hypothetical protein [Candidatus Woesearchaeota archaeon]
MRKLEDYITLANLKIAKDHLVPYIFTENYYNILKKKVKAEKLSENERYYYSHFIKKKLEGMIELVGIDTMVSGKELIRKDRLNRAISLLKAYSRKHRNMKMLISGSFLYGEKYNDIDIFAVSKYGKEDYRDGKVHVNYLPADVEKTLFFHTISSISVANFKAEMKIEEDFDASDMLNLYEIVILLIMQKDDYLQELRDLIVRLEYISNSVILNSMQLRIITDKIRKSRNPIQVINKYLIAKIINAYNIEVLKKTLEKFIEKNSSPEKGRKIYENWKIYNQTYKEVIAVVA